MPEVKRGLTTIGLLIKKGTCSEMLMSVLDQAYGYPLEIDEPACRPLSGGFMRGYQCGMLWGSTLAAGAQANRLFGTGWQAEFKAVLASQHILEAFQARTRDRINCRVISQISSFTQKRQVLKYFVSGGAINCMTLAARFPPEAFNVINKSLSDVSVSIIPSPVSCSALMARKMGANESRIVMAAGLAGGIGLSGGGCGALGVAVWIREMRKLRTGVSRPSPLYGASDIVEDFLKISGSRFECSAITGRKFRDISEHAEYLRSGGCRDIINGLAEKYGK